jgi:glycosidase
MFTRPFRSSLFLWTVSGIVWTMPVVAQTDGEQSLRSFLGWIPLQPVTAGQQITIDMHRFYFSSPEVNERMVVVDSPDGRYEAQFDESSFELNVAVDKNATGLIEIPLQVFARADAGDAALGRKDTGVGVSQENVADRPLLEAVLLVGVQPADGYTFVYRAPGRSAGNVSVIGAFNRWDEKSHVMKSVGEGVYELFVRLPPGSHPYQFALDGRRVLDPENPEEFKDSSDVASSLARVGKTDRGDPPVVFAQEAADGRVVFRVVPGFAKVEQISTVLQLPDGNSRSVRHKMEDQVVTVDVADAPEGSWVRVVAADTMGNISNAARVPVRPIEGFLWQDGIVYHVLTDRFENGDTGNDGPLTDERISPAANFQGGDFSGISKKIAEGYFRDMGVNVLRLGPVLRGADVALDDAGNPGSLLAAYDGRAPVSHEEVEPRFGGEGGLVDLMASAKAANLRVVADWQLHHVHLEHALLKQQPGFFFKRGRLNEEWARRFDYDNPEAVKFVISHAVNFARKFAFDGYRVEQVDEVSRGFWWQYRAAVRKAVDPARKSPFYTLGETNQNRSAIAGFVGPNMLDGQVDLPLYRTLVEVFAEGAANMSDLERSLAESEMIYGKESIMSPSLGAPDLPRFMAWAVGEKGQPGEAAPTAEAYLKLKLALTFLMSIDGAPSIFYGDEIGLGGASAPESHRMMRWDREPTSEERSVREHFAKVATTRGKHPAMRYGSRRRLVAEGHRYAFVRAHLGDAVLAVWNRGLAQTEFSLRVAPEMPDGDYVDTVSGQKIHVTGGRAKFRLGPQSSALFVAP